MALTPSSMLPLGTPLPLPLLRAQLADGALQKPGAAITWDDAQLHKAFCEPGLG